MHLIGWIFATVLLVNLRGCVPSTSVLAIDSQVSEKASLGVDAARMQQTSAKKRLSYALIKDNVEKLQQKARNITVKVISDGNWGSGILVRRRGQSYTVLTNQHVLWIGNHFKVQTADGKVHFALRDDKIGFGKNDLGMLRFASKNVIYPIASLGCSLKLAAGTPVFAAGFPLPLTEQSSRGFKFTLGSISLISQKALEGGYQIGYSNDIEKGMSGGPVLNSNGEVIAVNGMHQEPLWGDPYIYQDGSKPTIEFNILSHASWGIPMEIAAHIADLKTDPTSCNSLSAAK